MLTQKELMARWHFLSVRSVQRMRKEFNLDPVDFYGVNPLFSLSDVERIEAERKEKRVDHIRTKSERRKAANILSLKQIRARAGKKKGCK